jgi:hypothetical protein
MLQVRTTTRSYTLSQHAYTELLGRLSDSMRPISSIDIIGEADIVGAN